MSLYNTILYAIVLILLSGVGVLCVLKGLREKRNQHLFFFIITNILFILSIYAGYEFLNPNNPWWTIFFFRLSFVFALFMSFFLCTFAYYYPRITNKIAPWKQNIFLGLTIVMALLSLSTDWFYHSVVIENGAIVGDVHGKFHGIYLTQYLSYSLLAIVLSFQKNFQLSGIEKIKNILTFTGIFIVLMGTILFYTILPKFNIYLLQEEGGLFSIFFLFLVSYSMIKYRFLDIRLTITRFSKNITALFITLLFVYGMVELWFVTPFVQYFEYVIPVFLIGALYIHKYVSSLLIPYLFHRFFGFTSIEFFETSLKKLFTQSYAYSGIDDLKEDIIQFLKMQRIGGGTLFLVQQDRYRTYADFFDYFLRYPEALIQNEYPFLDAERKNVPEKRPVELRSLGEVCFPLFRSPDTLLGIFIVGKKIFGDHYSAEEIKLLERLKIFIELRLTGILHRDYLNREIAKKTEAITAKNKEIQQSYVQLKELDKAKDTFLSIASHELRTPMTVIKGFVDLLLANSATNLTQQQVSFLSTIAQNVDDLSTLVNKMLDISSLEAGKMEFVWKDVQFPEILESIIQEFQIMGQERNVHIVLQVPKDSSFSIRTDPLKIKQIIGNLLGNALKFSHEGDVVTVVVEKRKGKDSAVAISIIDTGIGIPREEQMFIFDKFYRTKHSSQKTHSGTGLGLHIVQLLVQKLGGTISVQSQKNKGACFTFSLPHQTKE